MRVALTPGSSYAIDPAPLLQTCRGSATFGTGEPVQQTNNDGAGNTVVRALMCGAHPVQPVAGPVCTIIEYTLHECTGWSVPVGTTLPPVLTRPVEVARGEGELQPLGAVDSGRVDNGACERRMYKRGPYSTRNTTRRSDHARSRQPTRGRCRDAAAGGLPENVREGHGERRKRDTTTTTKKKTKQKTTT